MKVLVQEWSTPEDGDVNFARHPTSISKDAEQLAKAVARLGPQYGEEDEDGYKELLNDREALEPRGAAIEIEIDTESLVEMVEDRDTLFLDDEEMQFVWDALKAKEQK